MKRFRLFLALALLVFTACSPAFNGTRNASGPDVVILGDSYSTFEGCIPEGYANWYFYGEGGNDVHRPSQCWWSLLCAQKNYNLLYNSSYSGSAICRTGYTDRRAPETSFVDRAKVDIVDDNGNIGRCGKKPDILFIFGGTNDDWSRSPLGQVPDNWRNGDLKEYFPAVCYLFGFLKEKLPGTEIVFILNTDLSERISNPMPDICRQYGVKCITLFEIDKISNHPSVAGMKKIANQVAAAM